MLIAVRHIAWTAGLLLLGALVVPAFADTVWVGSGAKALERKNMKIEGVTSDGLMFRSASSDRAAEPKPLKEVARIQVDSEPVLSAAETAYAAQKWDEAAKGYQRAISTSRTDWVKHFATQRLIVAAEKSGKFSASAGAYAALVARDPKAAADVKPEISKDKAELVPAINAVKAVLGDAKLKPAQRDALQAFLAELYIANGQLKDAEAIGATAKVAQPTAKTNSPTREADPATPDAPAPAANRGQIDLKLQLAVAAIKQKKFQDAIDSIDTVAPSLADPEQQAEALFTIAEAKAGLAGNDPAKLKDAALAYMRVVAHFKAEPNAPHVSESLLKAGAVLEQAKLLPDALAAYQAIQTDYRESPQAKEAAAGAARVRKAIEDAKS